MRLLKNGVISSKKRNSHSSELTDEEVKKIQTAIQKPNPSLPNSFSHCPAFHKNYLHALECIWIIERIYEIIVGF